MKKIEEGKTIVLGECTLVHRGTFCTNYFSTGEESSNWSHPDDQFYCDIAAQCGHDDLMTYCFEHEFCHSFLPMKFFGRESYVVWMAAQQRKASISAAMMEERMIYYFQRFLHHDNIVPMDDAWHDYKKEALELLYGTA